MCKYYKIFKNYNENLILEELLNEISSQEVGKNVFSRGLFDKFPQGEQLFLYYGPRDENNRNFCASLVGKVLKKSQLLGILNKDGNSPLQYVGGYGCRHRLVLVTPEIVQKLRLEYANNYDLESSQEKD